MAIHVRMDLVTHQQPPVIPIAMPHRVKSAIAIAHRHFQLAAHRPDNITVFNQPTGRTSRGIDHVVGSRQDNLGADRPTLLDYRHQVLPIIDQRHTGHVIEPEHHGDDVRLVSQYVLVDPRQPVGSRVTTDAGIDGLDPHTGHSRLESQPEHGRVGPSAAGVVIDTRHAVTKTDNANRLSASFHPFSNPVTVANWCRKNWQDRLGQDPMTDGIGMTSIGGPAPQCHPVLSRFGPIGKVIDQRHSPTRGHFATRLNVLLEPHVGMLTNSVGLCVVSPSWLGHQHRRDAPAEQFGDQPHQVGAVLFSRQPACGFATIHKAVVGAIHDGHEIRL